MGELSSVAGAARDPREGGGLTATDDARRLAERELVRRAQAGDAAAFEDLYRENVRRVYALSCRMTGNADLAEELTQEVFVRAWRKLASFRGESAFASWLFPLTVNVVYSEGRTRRRRESRVQASDDLAAHGAAAPAETPAERLDLEKALGRLPAGAREVFVLHDAYGYKHEEIASMTGIATGTSKAQLHRARRLLRETLRQ
jgi:RNA polymerase sigma-70 factor (ECF subfamily)